MSDELKKLGEVRNLGYDRKGYERREMVVAIAACPKCGKDVPLIGDTEAWTQGDDGRWHHLEYSLGTGECCGLLIADNFERCEVYKLETP